jgi:hypothetical protein
MMEMSILSQNNLNNQEHYALLRLLIAMAIAIPTGIARDSSHPAIQMITSALRAPHQRQLAGSAAPLLGCNPSSPRHANQRAEHPRLHHFLSASALLALDHAAPSRESQARDVTRGGFALLGSDRRETPLSSGEWRGVRGRGDCRLRICE